MTPVDYVIIGSRVRRRRKESGLTQEQLAEMAAISTPFLGHIERGTRKCSVETLVHIAGALDVCICRLIPQTHTCSATDENALLIDEIKALIISRTEKRSLSD